MKKFCLLFIVFLFTYRVVLSNGIREEAKVIVEKNTNKIINGTEKTNKNLPTETKKNQEKKIVSPSNDEYYKSFAPFMNSKNNLDTIKKAVARYEKVLGTKKKGTSIGIQMGEINQDDEDAIDSTNIDKNIGNVYLRSILYISKNNWTIWVNDQKITSKNNGNDDDEFVVKRISNDTVDFVWSILRSKWKFININDKITSNMYKINENTNKIEINLSLHPNQTFVASENTIIDGKYRENIFLIEKEPENKNIVEENINFDDILKDL